MAIVCVAEFGSACHLGVSVDTACIGVAKKLFQVDGLEKDENHQKKVGRTTSMPLNNSSSGTQSRIHINQTVMLYPVSNVQVM